MGGTWQGLRGYPLRRIDVILCNKTVTIVRKATTGWKRWVFLPSRQIASYCHSFVRGDNSVTGWSTRKQVRLISQREDGYSLDAKYSYKFAKRCRSEKIFGIATVTHTPIFASSFSFLLSKREDKFFQILFQFIDIVQNFVELSLLKWLLLFASLIHRFPLLVYRGVLFPYHVKCTSSTPEYQSVSWRNELIIMSSIIDR